MSFTRIYFASMKETIPAPVIKWVGGKRQLLPEIKKRFPKRFNRYYEPFFGGGAVLFSMLPERAVVNDINDELVNLYTVIKSKPNKLIQDLETHRNEVEYFYEIRALDRDTERFQLLSDVQRASRTIFLNKTCYNGLFRVNRAGQFNAPFGRYKNPNIVNRDTIRAVSGYLKAADVSILNGDFTEAVKDAKAGDFVYFDPPYDPISDSSNFTSYAKDGFNRDSQIRLKELCDALHKRGVFFMLSNSATDFIRELYSDYTVDIVGASRAVNSNAAKRGKVSEVLVRNYE